MAFWKQRQVQSASFLSTPFGGVRCRNAEPIISIRVQAYARSALARLLQ